MPQPNRTPSNRILIIGGGASGMLAAIAAARAGAQVQVIERMRRVGEKILATGNGRCNLTNTHVAVSHYHGEHPQFVEEVFQQFNLEQTLVFFRQLGVETKEEDGGKIYPLCEQASGVQDALRFAMQEADVQIHNDMRIQRLDVLDKGFRAVDTSGETFHADRVILATGGKSAPNLGSNGAGYKIAGHVGHRIVEPFPALVQIQLDAWFLKRLKGLKLPGQATIAVDGRPKRTESGDLLFTEYGISGPPIFQISRYAAQYAQSDTPVDIRLNQYPDHTPEALHRILRERIASLGHRSLEHGLIGLVHKRLIPVLLKEAGIDDIQRPLHTLDSRRIRTLVQPFNEWTIPCKGTESWMHSQVTAGGIDVRQVDNRTMESRLVPGLYFAGEVLDIDGDCGGYNLQWAWSSGYVAGIGAAIAGAC